MKEYVKKINHGLTAKFFFDEAIIDAVTIHRYKDIFYNYEYFNLKSGKEEIEWKLFYIIKTNKYKW